MNTGSSAGLNPYPFASFAGWNPHPFANFAGWNPDPVNGQALNPYPTGGTRFAAWNPDPKGGAKQNPNPTGGQNMAADLQPDPRTASPWPWRRFDPDWTYDGGDKALLSQALRKMRSRVVGEQDVRRSKAEMGKVREQEASSQDLWRWASEFRQQAVVAEMLAHTVVHQRCVYLARHDFAANPPAAALHLLFQLQALTTDGAAFDYSQQIDKVLRAAVEREERLPEILTQATDFRVFFYSLCGLDSVPTPHLDELILVAWGWATHVVMTLKNNVAELRPVQRSSLVVPVIATPQHGSMPSGHATVAAMTAELLAVLMYGAVDDPRGQVLRRLASRIAFNRVVAGVHFPMDSLVGWGLGTQLASVFWGMAQEKAPLPTERILMLEEADQWMENDSRLHDRCGPSSVDAPALASLQALWTAADRELRKLRF